MYNVEFIKRGFASHRMPLQSNTRGLLLVHPTDPGTFLYLSPPARSSRMIMDAIAIPTPCHIQYE